MDSSKIEFGGSLIGLENNKPMNGTALVFAFAGFLTSLGVRDHREMARLTQGFVNFLDLEAAKWGKWNPAEYEKLTNSVRKGQT